MLNHIRDLPTIRDIVTPATILSIADATVNAYDLDPDEGDIAGMRAAASPGIYSDLSDEFLYWVYTCAILEDIEEDDDGYRSDDYLFELNSLNALLGRDTAITQSYDALAYARCMLVSSAPDASVAGVDLDAVVALSNKIAAGLASMDDIEKIGNTAEGMWSMIA